jgi:hypothetical protein
VVGADHPLPSVTDGCIVTLEQGCPLHPDVYPEGSFRDDEATASTDMSRCQERTEVNYIWCGSPVRVRIVFKVNGTILADTIYPEL